MLTPDAQKQLQLAAMAYQSGAWDQAAVICSRLLITQPNAIGALLLLGSIHGQRGNPEAAVELLTRARAVDGRNAHVLNALGAALRETGKFDDARAALTAATEIDPQLVPAFVNLGNVCSDVLDNKGGRAAYERALALDPNAVNALAGLSEIAEEEHKLDEADALAARALKINPRSVIAQMAMARTILRRRDFEKARAMFADVLANRALQPRRRSVALGCYAEALDALKDYDGAFKAHEEAQKILFPKPDEEYRNIPSPFGTLALDRMFAILDDPCLRASASLFPAGERSPVFLIGFSRSGTTLAGQILASHAGVQLLDEKDTLFESYGPMFLDEGAAGRWREHSTEELQRLRSLYWARVEKYTGPWDGKTLLVDKQPLLTALLPLVYRLFPHAKLIFAIRDPRDVILSCFQQRFAWHLPEHRRLDTLTAYYDRVMEMGRRARETLPFAVHDYRYEALVSDFDTEAQRLLSFLDLPWSDSVRDFSETAKRGKVAAPSARQVVRPLYTTSQGKWRNYRKFLEPNLPILNRWVEAFRYAD